MQARNILVRGVNWLGDAIMSTPALQRLREASPHATITLLTPRKLADLWPHYPHVDRVLSFSPREGLLTLARRLRSHRFDLALILPNSPRSALESFAAGIPQRVGYARPWRNWLLTRPIAPRPGEIKMEKRSPGEIQTLLNSPHPPAPPRWPSEAHHVFHYLHLLAALSLPAAPTPPRLEITDPEKQRAREKFGINGSPLTPWLGLNAGAEYGAAKRWPESHFVETAAQVHAASPSGWLIFGGPADLALAARLEKALADRHIQPVRNLAGKTSLRELAATLSLCRALLTNDTGPMHLSAAVHTPVVALFGSTAPELTGPDFGHPPHTHQILRIPTPCAPCFLRDCPVDHRCLRRLPPELAIQALMQSGRL